MIDRVRAYIGIGSNLDDPVGHVRAAVAALARLPETTLIVRSSLYRTAPVGLQDQPEFINAVAALDTRLPPAALMQQLFAIERAEGRTRGPVGGGPRTLDLDLLLYGYLKLASAELTIPHPRMRERAFVLAPLHEIAPSLRIPGDDPVSALLDRCSAQSVVRLADGAMDRASTG